MKHNITEVDHSKKQTEFHKIDSNNNISRIISSANDESGSVFEIDITRLSTKHIIAEKKRKAKNYSSRMLKIAKT